MKESANFTIYLRYQQTNLPFISEIFLALRQVNIEEQGN